MLAPAVAGGTVTPVRALGIADVYACVRCLADAAASLPLVPYRRVGEGRRRLDGPTADLLTAPAPGVTQANLVGQAMSHLQLYGNAFVGKYREAGGSVGSLGLLHPERVSVELQAGRPVYTYRPPVTERPVVLTTDDVIHVRALSVDGLLGLSPVRQARDALSLSAALTAHGTALMENGARPSGVLKVPAGPAVQDQIDALAGAWDARHRGGGNAGRIAVLSGDIAFEAISLPLEDAQFIEQRRLSATEIARVFRVPPWMIGAESGSAMTYSNVESQALAFVTYSLRPWLVLIEQALSADTDLFPGSLYCEFLVDALLRSDSKTRADVYSAALDPLTGWLTREEVRQRENLPPEATQPPQEAPLVAP